MRTLLAGPRYEQRALKLLLQAPQTGSAGTSRAEQGLEGFCFWSARMPVNFERLREALIYHPDTGELISRASGKPVGTSTRGYLRVRVDGQRFYAHRLAWILFHEAEPSGEIDHINGDRADNRIANLRDVSSSLNRANLHRPVATNRLGVLGVRLHRCGKYEARIRLDGKQIVLGYFINVTDAADAVAAARTKRFAMG